MLYKLGNEISKEGDLGFCSIAHIDNLPDFDTISYAEMSNHEGPEITTPLAIKALFNGHEYFEINKKDIGLSKNEFLIINPGQHYKSKIQTKDLTHTFSLTISQRTISEVIHGLLSPVEKQLDDLSSSLSFPYLFWNEVHKGDYGFLKSLEDIKKLVLDNDLDIFQLKESIYRVVTRLFLKHEKIRKDIQKVPAIKNGTRREILKRLTLTKEFIEAEFTNGITLDSISKVSAISPYYLIRLFNNVFGITPHQYIMKLKLQKARGLLVSTKLNISEICNLLNIQSQQSFSNLFNREFNCSPLLFRKKNSKINTNL